MRTRRSHRNQERLWQALGGKVPKAEPIKHERLTKKPFNWSKAAWAAYLRSKK